MASDADDLANLRTVRSNLIARMATLSLSIGPDVSDQGRSVSWKSLSDQLKTVEEAIQMLEGPWQVESRGRAING